METHFFRCITPPDSSWAKISPGDCIAAYYDEAESHWVVKGHDRCTNFFSKEGLLAHFTPITEAEFEAHLAGLMQSINSLTAEQAELLREISSASTLALGSGTEDEAQAAGSALARRPAGGLRNKALALKRRMLTLASSLKERQEKITVMMEQRMAAIQATVASMQEHVSKLEEVVWMVNLYLGRDEEIVVLRSGDKAPAGTPIALRQSVLYMDEEIALHDLGEDGKGIDYSNIENFDAWLLAGNNLNAIMPEAKGVIVLQIRRNPKEYDISRETLSQALRDSIESAHKNELNMRSYWLIRNGDNLYRLWSDIRVGKRLIPTLAEFDDFFHYSGFGREGPIRPGSKEYYKAMDRAQSHNRHYMRLGLVLQGLIDRTQVFAPFKDNIRPNIIDESTWNDQVRIVRDEEATITDGRPSFSEWLKGINRELHPGLRVLAGRWPLKRNYDRDRYEAERQYPATAEAPAYEIPHTLATVRKGIGFYYERSEKIWKRERFNGHVHADPKRRASYMVYAGDDFFVCIDNVTNLEEVEYYLNDRRRRQDYETMIPLLKRVIAFKKAEQEAEAPFRELLLRKINEAHPAHPCDEATLSRLVLWWKMRRSEHRALLSDDKQAYHDIIAEYARQFGETSAGSGQDREAIEVLAKQPDAIALWSKGGGCYCLLRSIPGQPVYCHLETHKKRKSGWELIERKEWVLPRKYDFLRWSLLHTTPEWSTRPEAPNRASFLPGTAYPQLVEWLNTLKPEGVFSGRTQAKLLALYLFQTAKGTIIKTAWWTPDSRGFSGWCSFSDDEKTKPPAIMDHHHTPECTERNVRWEVDAAAGYKFTSGYSNGSRTYVSSREFRRGYADEDAVVLFLDATSEAEIRSLLAKAEAHNDRQDDLRRWINEQEHDASAHLLQLWRDRESQKYLAEGGDPEFTEDHLRTLRQPKVSFERELYRLLTDCVNAVSGDLQKLTGEPLATLLPKLCSAESIKEASGHHVLRELLTTNWTLSLGKEAPEEE